MSLGASRPPHRREPRRAIPRADRRGNSPWIKKSVADRAVGVLTYHLATSEGAGPWSHRSIPASIRRTITRGGDILASYSWAIVWCCAAMVSLAAAGAADLEEAAKLLRTGRYEECEKQASAALQGGTHSEDWYALKIRAEMARGKYEEALESLEEATRPLSREPDAVPDRPRRPPVQRSWRPRGRGTRARSSG